MGGYFIGRPMDQEIDRQDPGGPSRVTPQATWAGQGTSGPAYYKSAQEKGPDGDQSPNTTRSIDLEGEDLE